MAKVLVEGVEGTRARWDERPSRRYGCEGDHSYYLTDGSAKTVQRNGEKHRTDRGQCEELRPHHVDTRPPVQDGLAGGDEVRGWRCQHHLLHQLGHACARG